MARYICQKATCPNANGFESAQLPPKCPKCQGKVFLAPTQAAKKAVERMVAVGDSPTKGFTEAKGDKLTDCQALIQKFDITLTSTDESKTTKDCVVKLDTRAKRIDRQGAQTTYTKPHARYAVQIGDDVNAGLHMEADSTFTKAHVQLALTRSLTERRYYRIYVDWI